MLNKLLSLPLLKSLVRATNDEAIIYAIVTILGAVFLENQEYSGLLVASTLAIGGVLSGVTKWEDIQIKLAPYADQIEGMLEGIVQTQLTIPVPGSEPIVLDVPDSMEPALVASLVKALTGKDKEEDSSSAT